MWSRSSANVGRGPSSGGSNTAAHPTCMWAVGVSTVKNDASSADSRVGDMNAPPLGRGRRSGPRATLYLRRAALGRSGAAPHVLAQRARGHCPYPSRAMATTPDHEKPTIAPIVGPDDPRRFTDSGIEIKTEYTDEDVKDGVEERLGEPGEYPFTRGIHAEMYRSRRWTIRQYAGYASAKETNERFRYLIDH